MGKKREAGAAKFPRAAKPRQKQIPGTEDVHDPALSDLALAYVDARDYRMQLTTEEVKAKTALLAAMADRKIAVYHDPVNELDVEVVPSDVKLKVTHRDTERGESSAGLPEDQKTEAAG